MAVSRHDPGEYGRSFADVYDTWYPGGDEQSVVTFLAAELPPGARILELGVGTGRVALPLAGAGFEVWGMDSSQEMLAVLAGKDRAGTVNAVLADAGDPATWPSQWGSAGFDCVLAACNLLLNLAAPGAQQACVSAAGALLGPGGIFVSELSRISMPPTRSVERTASTAVGGTEVLVTTEADPDTGLVLGRHEGAGGPGGPVRSWRIRPLDPEQLRSWCRDAGLVEVSTHPGWERSGPGPDAATVVTVHRRPG